MKKEIIKAVYDKDLKKLLDRLNLLEKFQQGLLKCNFCNTIITFNNLQGIYKKDNNIKLVCDSPECYKKVIEELK